MLRKRVSVETCNFKGSDPKEINGILGDNRYIAVISIQSTTFHYVVVPHVAPCTISSLIPIQPPTIML